MLHPCPSCHLIQQVPELKPGTRAVCPRCGGTVSGARPTRGMAVRCAALAGAAFVLFWPAVLFPILTIEKVGNRHQASILEGIRDLFQQGQWFVGGIILVFSIVFPLLKLLVMLELSLFQVLSRNHRSLWFRAVEIAGKWSMLDVLLLAFLVMTIKLGSMVSFHYGPAIYYFTFCVAFSMMASICFDPRSIWDTKA